MTVAALGVYLGRDFFCVECTEEGGVIASGQLIQEPWDGKATCVECGGFVTGSKWTGAAEYFAPVPKTAPPVLAPYAGPRKRRLSPEEHREIDEAFFKAIAPMLDAMRSRIG